MAGMKKTRVQGATKKTMGTKKMSGMSNAKKSARVQSPVAKKIAAAKKQAQTMRTLGMPLGTQIYRNRKPYPAKAQARMERAAARVQKKKGM